MASLIERIRAHVLQLGRGAAEQIDFVMFGDQGTANPAFRIAAGGTEMLMRSGGRTTFRRFERSTTTLAADLTLNEAYHNAVILVNSTAAIRTVTLPAPANGLVFHIVDALSTAATNNITIARNGSEKIDNVAASLVLNKAGQRVTLYSNGTDWFSISKVAEAPYSSGTANAAFVTGGGSATINSSVRTITWHRIGQVVTFAGRLDMSAVSSPTGALNITGLPYTAAIDTAVSLSFVKTRGFNSLAQGPYGKILASASQITVEEFEDGDSADFANQLLAASTFIIGGSYITAQ